MCTYNTKMLDYCSQIYDLATGQKITTLSDTKNSNNYLKNIATFNSTDELVLNDGLLWDVRMAKVIHKFDKFNNYVSGVFHPSDLEIIINSEIVSLCLESAATLFEPDVVYPSLSLCILLLEKWSVSCTVYDSEILHLLSNLNIFNSGIFALFIFLIHVRLWINVALPSTTEVMLYLEVSFASQMFTIRCISPVPAILVKL